MRCLKRFVVREIYHAIRADFEPRTPLTEHRSICVQSASETDMERRSCTGMSAKRTGSPQNGARAVRMYRPGDGGWGVDGGGMQSAGQWMAGRADGARSGAAPGGGERSAGWRECGGEGGGWMVARWVGGWMEGCSPMASSDAGLGRSLN
jgi:hypothetical protein